MKERDSKTNAEYSRRNFLISSAKAGTSLAMASSLLGRAAWAQTPEPTGKKPGDLSVALIGAGAQGRVLMESCLRIPGIRFKAICDIWEYSQTYAQRFLKKYGHDVNVYVDYADMLAQEGDLDAVIVASPDWMHAEHAIAAMQTGYPVYCEKEMSNSLEKAREMVETSRKTGKLLQIGHQRRSNPRYLHAIDTLIRDVHLLGRVTHAQAQWNRSKSEDLGWPKKYEIDAATLQKYGYDSMSHFRNWRWYRKYGGGPIVDLGSHQIDLFAWVFGTDPKSVTASGGVDFYDTHEWFDNVMCIYEYENDEGTARAAYQVLTTTKHGGFYEVFMGEDGTIVISEVPQRGNAAEREAHAEPWEKYVEMGYLNQMKAPLARTGTTNTVLDVRVTLEAGKWPLPVELAKPAHQPHLENFFNAIRSGEPLNCPAEIGYETAVAVLAANDSVEAGRRIDFKPEDFEV
jgi:predicted dehydrogenase